MRTKHTVGPLANWALTIALMASATGSHAANAGSLSQKDVQILTKSMGFLEPPPSGASTIAIAYEPSDPSSRQDADAIASYFGDGLKAGGAVLTAKVTAVGQLGAGGFIAVVVASGANLDQVASATRSLHAACITADARAVEAGQCVMAVRSSPKVEILINRAAATSRGIVFGSAFLLMAHAL